MFFDDILVYSKSLAEHVQHLQITFDILRQNQLFVKLSKCSFAQETLEYLGHIISSEGVAADKNKVAAMLDWPTPTNVKGYGTIAKPFTQLLKKNQFKWSKKAELAFDQLKTAMATTPVLALPDFTKPFVVETDAS